MRDLDFFIKSFDARKECDMIILSVDFKVPCLPLFVLLSTAQHVPVCVGLQWREDCGRIHSATSVIRPVPL